MRPLRFCGLLLSLIWALICTPASAGALIDAYRAALAHDADLASAGAARDAAVQSRPQAWAALLPQLDLSAGVARDRYRAPDGATDAPADGDTRISGTRRSYAADLRQTLWSGEAFQRLRQADALVAQAQAEYLDARQSLILRVATTYFDVLSAADALAANRAEQSAYATLVEQARKRLQTGLGARIGVEEAQAFLSLTEQSVIDAEQALLDARQALLQITGVHTAIVALRTDIPLLPPQPADADDWLAATRRDNPAVQAAQMRAQAADRDAAATRNRHLPTLALEAAVGRTDQAGVLGGDERIDSVGVVAQWPIFSGGLIRAQAREAAARARQAQADYDSRLRRSEREALAAYRRVLAGIRNIRAAQLAVAANDTALQASRNGVESGTRTEFDLLNAQNNYYAALRSAYQSRYDYLASTLTLKAQAGRLHEADLEAIDALLSSDAGTVAMPPESAP